MVKSILGAAALELTDATISEPPDRPDTPKSPNADPATPEQSHRALGWVELELHPRTNAIKINNNDTSLKRKSLQPAEGEKQAKQQKHSNSNDLCRDDSHGDNSRCTELSHEVIGDLQPGYNVPEKDGSQDTSDSINHSQKQLYEDQQIDNKRGVLTIDEDELDQTSAAYIPGKNGLCEEFDVERSDQPQQDPESLSSTSPARANRAMAGRDALLAETDRDRQSSLVSRSVHEKLRHKAKAKLSEKDDRILKQRVTIDTFEAKFEMAETTIETLHQKLAKVETDAEYWKLKYEKDFDQELDKKLEAIQQKARNLGKANHVTQEAVMLKQLQQETEKVERKWQKKFDSQDVRHEKEQDAKQIQVEEAQMKVRHEKANVERVKQTLRLETKEQKSRDKKEAYKRVKELEVLLKDKEIRIAQLENSSEVLIDQVTTCNKEIKLLREQRESMYKDITLRNEKISNLDDQAVQFKEAIWSLKADNKIRCENLEAELEQQVKKFQIQRAHSEQNRTRVMDQHRQIRHLMELNEQNNQKIREMREPSGVAMVEPEELYSSGPPDFTSPRRNCETNFLSLAANPVEHITDSENENAVPHSAADPAQNEAEDIGAEQVVSQEASGGTRASFDAATLLESTEEVRLPSRLAASNGVGVKDDERLLS